MPLGRVIESFRPDGPRFDVVIVDESSQADTFGLLALMRAERALVVGDDNQISPAAVGQRLDIVDQLIAKHLGGIPNNGLYDGQQSLYDLATAAFGGVIRLREHFRCVPEIIGFSNALSYQGEIRPLRDPTSTALLPPVVLHRVAGYRAAGSDVNDEEARLIAALIAACCEHPLYKEATLGAISLLGEDQARLILERVRALVPPEELDRRAFIAGDAYHFQGDEREVMFLSLVEAPSERRPAVLNRRPDQQRFNVAASRARDQMWIVHSVDASHFHPDDMRARLLAHYAHRDDQARNWRDVSEVLRGERYYFQRLVAQQLIQRGYRVRAEVPVGQYRIDLVVDGESESLAVECDGERWHTLDTHREDVARQMTLERLGWEFFRVRGGHYFRDPERALAPLWRRFDELGITPVAGESANNNVAVADEILRRAEELLKQGADVPLGLTTESEAPATAPSVVDTPSPASRLESPVDAARVILEFLAHNPGWHGRQEIVTATGLDDEWRDAITHLLGRGLVVRRGAKRGTHYRAATPSPPPAAFSEGPQQAYGLEPGARDVPGPPRIDDEHATEDARRALIRLREGIVRPAFPDAPAERGLLRRAMLEAFLRHRPTSLTEYERRIPESLRQFTDPGQLRHLPEVFTILSRVPRP
jgi:very-short-patch-repair endonuclease